jgi:hypothetical protein
LVAFPDRADRVDRHPAFHIGLSDERQQRPNAEVKPVGQGKSDEQDTQQKPPDNAERVEIDQLMQNHLSYSAGASVKGTLPSWVRNRCSCRAIHLSVSSTSM